MSGKNRWFPKEVVTLPLDMERLSKDTLLGMLRGGDAMTFGQQAKLAGLMSLPAIMAQLSSVLMQFIDSAMVGNLGVNAAASVGLMSTCTWMFGGFCSAAAAGFSVPAAHLIGAKDFQGARKILRQGITALLTFSIIISLTGISISQALPGWLGGAEEIRHDAGMYFMIVMAGLPALQFEFFGAGMLQSSGNMKIPSMMSIVMCVLDVSYNFMLIYPSRTLTLSGMEIFIPGAGMGVEGAALGTVLAECTTVGILMSYILFRSKELHIIGRGERGSFIPTRVCINNALTISAPMALQNIIMRGAHVLSTIIVAPLGTIAIAANAFAITAESFCYMPGYGIADAATSLIGQSLGAKRKELAKGFARITVGLGMAVMSVMAIIMYALAPVFIGLMSNDAEVVALGAHVLRIECFAETMFAASIVGYGVCVGAGDTLIPSTINFSAMWIFRIIPAFFLTKTMGLAGFWISMCAELNIRGLLFLWRLHSGKWLNVRMKVDNIDLAQFHHFLLTCDGIHDYLTLDEMEDILGQCNGDWSKAIGELITRAKESGSPDDCSAVIIDCDLSSIESCCDVNDEQKHEPIQQNNPGSTMDCISDEYAQNIEVAPSSTESMSTAKNKLWNFFKKKPEHREE